jgi:hypothetical protein
VRPGNYDRFFADGGEPKDEEDRRRAATAVLSRFATRAFRRPVDLTTVTRYVDFAETEYQQPGKTFEQGVARAMVAILASPRFLFRIEATEPSPADASGQGYPRLDEYSLASRLSYFFWSTMPDEALHRLAESNQLRANLEREVKRLLTDSKSRELVENFTGQWLQLRDIEGVSINEGSILFRERTPRNLFVGPPAPVGQGRGNRRGRIEFDRDLRLAMRRESEMLFAHIMREDRPALELVDADYTFLNERLATHYGILDVKGEEMRRVELPEGSPRGGVLTQGAVLAVTSNPTRTSPVKRGLFILDNLLGTPAPPPPEVVPQLEESEKAIEGHEPTLREVLELHRSKPLCAACHARMDPLGLALEEFNAMGMHRTMERGLPIEGGGQLITGERFQNIRELKKVLTDSRRGDFYRCLTEKLMTYALGRGLEASDVETVDQIVDRLEKNDGRFSGLLMGIVESAPFQKLRPPGGETRAASLSSKDTSRLLSEAKP